MMKTCPQCGFESIDAQKKCPNCGFEFVKADEANEKKPLIRMRRYPKRIRSKMMISAGLILRMFP